MLHERLPLFFDQELIFDTFRSLPHISSPPNEQVPFYIRNDNRVMRLTPSYEKNITFGDFVPWDRSQIWLFIRFKDSTGWLVNLDTKEYIGHGNGRLMAKRAYEFIDDKKDIFEFDDGWTHVTSGEQLSGEIVPVSSLIGELSKHNINWPNTISDAQNYTFWPSLW